MTMTRDREFHLPVPTPETAPFWKAASEGSFVLKWCRCCDRTHWFPRSVCPHCMGMDLEWRQASGEGVIYAFTVVEGANDLSVIAMVTLREGPTVTTNIVDSDTDHLAIGVAVEVAFKSTVEGGRLPVFRLAAR